MTRKEFKKSVWLRTVGVMRKHGLRLQDVVITGLYIAVGDHVGGFYAQGESRDEIMKDCPEDINPRVWLLYYLDSAGAI